MSEGAQGPKAEGSWSWAFVAALFCASIVAYLPALTGAFVWNDSDYVTQAPLRSLHGLWRIWFEVGATEQYYPLLHSAFWLEHRVWGDASVGYHLLNVLLHATAACLFAAVLRALSVRGAWLAAFVFALHPVCVESVAWISEQKNTLSTVFYLSSALAYLRFDRERSRGRYALAICLFAAALLSKTVTATLPGALLVALWWRRGRLDWKADVLPLTPWLLLGAGAGLFSAWVERAVLGAAGPAFNLTFAQRSLVAARAFWFYLGKLLWPARLIFIYPRWDASVSALPLLALAAALALVSILWMQRGRSRAPLAAVLFFAGSLFPVLGFLNVYAFLYSFVADHFQYLACLGIVALAAAAWARWDARRPAAGPASPTAPRLAAAAALCMLGALTWRQCGMYRDVETFYRTTIERNPGCWMARNNLGDVLSREGRVPEAVEQYAKVVKLKPDFIEARYNLANALSKDGRALEAIDEYRRALSLNSDFPQAHYNLANALSSAGRPAEAIGEYEEALRLDPSLADACNNMGIAYYHMGRLADAVGSYERAVRIRPDFVEVHGNLGVALAESGRMSEAIAHFEKAVELDPASGQCRRNLAAALRAAGRGEEAAAQLREAARLGAGPGQP